jgi:hypothetical protein
LHAPRVVSGKHSPIRVEGKIIKPTITKYAGLKFNSSLYPPHEAKTSDTSFDRSTLTGFVRGIQMAYSSSGLAGIVVSGKSYWGFVTF